MKQISIDSVEHLEHKIISIETQYPEYHILDMHVHKRAQLLYGAEGTIHVMTQHGNWIIPPERAVWIPAGIPHQLMMYKVKTCSLYILPEYSPRQSIGCEVLSISPLLRQLLLKAPSLNEPFSQHDDLVFELILKELSDSSSVDLHLSLPENEVLLKACQAFLKEPNIHTSPKEIAETLCISERHFSRIFKNEMGMSFSKWRQHACIFLSLEKLIQKKPIHRIAYDLGFQNPAAFTTLFQRTLGMSPSKFSIQKLDP